MLVVNSQITQFTMTITEEKDHISLFPKQLYKVMQNAHLLNKHTHLLLQNMDNNKEITTSFTQQYWRKYQNSWLGTEFQISSTKHDIKILPYAIM